MALNGGKSYLASRIVELMPPHLHYVEPYAGGLAVMLADPKGGESRSEVVNDLDKELTNFWRVLQHPEQFAEFVRVCEATPFSEAEWTRAMDGLGTYTSTVGRAWAFFVFCRQSMAGRMKCFSPITRARTRRGMNEQVSAWLSAVEGLPEVHARLKRVLILDGRDALDVIRSEDSQNTLFYLDPPYPHSTRNGHTPADYAHEMSNIQHQALLSVLESIKGKFLLSSYHNPMYDSAFLRNAWRCEEYDLPNHASHAAEKRRMIECIYMNF